MTQSKHTPVFIDALLNYSQADMDGIIVTVSRQAIHEAVDSHTELLEALEDYVRACENQDIKLGHITGKAKDLIAKAKGYDND